VSQYDDDDADGDAADVSQYDDDDAGGNEADGRGKGQRLHVLLRETPQ
jgi:hypothetical protein